MWTRTCIALGILVASSGARAQSPRAEALFRDGTQLMADGKPAQACDAFDASNRIEPRAGTLISLGQCREQNGQLASAWSAYKLALARVKDPRKREFATTRVAELEPRLSSITVAVSAASRVEGLVITRSGAPVEPAQWNHAAPVDGGDYVITARAPDHEGWQATVHVARSNARLTVAVPRLKEARQTSSAAAASSSPSRPPSAAGASSPSGLSSAPGAPSPSEGPSPSASPPGAALEPVAGEASSGATTEATTEATTGATTEAPVVFTPARKIAVGLAGASVVSVVVGVALGVSANGQEDDAFKLCPDPAAPCAQARRSNELIESSHGRASAANVAFVIGALTATTAGVLWLAGKPDLEAPGRVSLVPGVAPGAASVFVTGRF